MTDISKLKAPFPPSDVSWRIGQAGENNRGIWAKVLAYLTNRAIMDRLDEVVGAENWRNEFQPGPQGGVICGLSLRINNEWITKWDGAENSDIEAVKGGLSDSMKRAAVQWGIGRYLYDLGESWATISENGAHYANCKIKKDGQDKWINFKWDHPKLPAWALPNGTPEQKAATIEQESAGKVQRPVSEKPPELVGAKLTKTQQATYEKDKGLIMAATNDEELELAGKCVGEDLAAKKITDSLADMLRSTYRIKKQSLAAMAEQNEFFDKVLAVGKP